MEHLRRLLAMLDTTSFKVAAVVAVANVLEYHDGLDLLVPLPQVLVVQEHVTGLNFTLRVVLGLDLPRILVLSPDV
jgi:hypothetical protein